MSISGRDTSFLLLSETATVDAQTNRVLTSLVRSLSVREGVQDSRQRKSHHGDLSQASNWKARAVSRGRVQVAFRPSRMSHGRGLELHAAVPASA